MWVRLGEGLPTVAGVLGNKAGQLCTPGSPALSGSPPLSPSHRTPPPTPRKKNLPVQQRWQIPVLQACLNHHGAQPAGEGKEERAFLFP